MSQADIAIACASHRATDAQVQAAWDLLEKTGCTEDDLELGLQRERPPHRIYNNCSGKHAGMLALCRAHGWPTRGYREPEHPVQQACASAHAEAAGVDGPHEFPTGNDGCGVVTFAMPLERMALAFATLPSLDGAHRIVDAMRARPDLIGGEDGADVLLIRHTPHVIAKGGAEGLLCAVDTGTSTGYALKAEDGASRALTAAAAAFMGVDLPPTVVRNTRGEIVGDVSLQTMAP